MADVYDKNGREIMVGDVLKVFHFQGARRKRHYMFKQVLGLVTFRQGGPTYLKISHLNMRDDYYTEAVDGRMLPGVEIIQSVDARFEERPKRAA